MTLYQKRDLYEQITFLAYYLHWSSEEILSLPHMDRERLIKEINRIHSKEQGKQNIFDVS